MLMPNRPDCKQCYEYYNLVKKSQPPCVSDGKCPNGHAMLWPNNVFAWELWQKLSGQVIVAGMGEPLGIRFEAIQFIFELYQIDDPDFREELFEKILIIDSVRMHFKSQEIIKHRQQMSKKK